MNFAETLNLYIEKLGCSGKELSKASELSDAVISRYRAGERQPELRSEQVEKLIAGIVEIAIEKSMDSITSEVVSNAFAEVLEDNQYDYEKLVANFNTIISVWA